MRLKRKGIFLAFAGTLLTVGLVVGFRVPLLARLGYWLAVETPVLEAELVVALGGDRVRQEEAVRLLKQGLARWVLFVGSHVRLHDYRCLDVPADHMVPPPGPAYTTYEEAAATCKVVQDRGIRSVLIVTSPYHSRRARWTFEKVLGGTGVTLLVSSAPETAFRMGEWWRSHIGRKAVLGEYLGLLYYRLTL